MQSRKKISKYFLIAVLPICFSAAVGLRPASAQVATAARSSDASRRSGVKPIHVPNRPEAALFQGAQGKQRTEIHFEPATGVVTLKTLVQDANGYFIPNIRRENFVVYENGVRQHNATVEIEHAPVSVGLLLEYGGRYQALNKAIGEEVSRAARGFLDEMGRNDKIVVWKYADTLEEVSGFSEGLDTLESRLAALRTPPISELNFYDALTSALARMGSVTGRKALIVISSGLDTFSKASYQTALSAARQSDTPIYVINIGPPLQADISLAGAPGPWARLDWRRAEQELQELATASGGRLYSPQSTFDLTGIYDDLMENLRVRYVITYRSTATGDLNATRTVRVELVNPATGGPLEIVDANGKPVRFKVFVEDSYVPQMASGGDSKRATRPAR
jgi:Ca-activated chloride channel family protein